MGPRGLNSFFKKSQPDGIRECQIVEFSGKTIVIDASIYLYRFNTNNELIENLYIMLSIFKQNNIIPLFVFDGKPPVEKLESLNIRKQERQEAEELYNRLINSNIEKNKFTIERLKRKKTRLNTKERDEARRLLEVCGVSYIDARGEADEVCAQCVINGIAYACLSDDMDLFIYGCPRVLRYFSMMNKTVVYYDLNKILTSLDIKFTNFKIMTILSGTDYNEQIIPIEKFYNRLKNEGVVFLKTIISQESIDALMSNYDICDAIADLSNRKYFNYNRDKEIEFLSSHNFIFIE